MKILTRILVVLVLLLLIIVYIACDARYIAPKRYTTRKEILSSETVPAGLDGLRIVFFSDLDYGKFMNEDRLAKLTAHINDLSADIILFGGDVYDTGIRDTDADHQKLTDFFSGLQAPYGKFAVLGDRDNITDDHAEAITSILYDGGFEVLHNRSMNLHHGGSSYFTLVGLDNGINSTPDIREAYSKVSRNAYVLTLCHNPDIAESLPGDLTDRLLAGHTHGGQAYWGFDSLVKDENVDYYSRGQHLIHDTFTLDITSGVGTTIKDIRFLTHSETVLYVMNHTADAAEDPVMTEQPEKQETPAPADSTAEDENKNPAEPSEDNPEALQDAEDNNDADAEYSEDSQDDDDAYDEASSEDDSSSDDDSAEDKEE